MSVNRSLSLPTTLLVPLLALVFSVAAHAREAQVFESECGGAKFRVTATNHEHPLSNTYNLAALSPTGVKELFKSGEGGWFHAACLSTRRGRPVLVFQSYCGGSGCLEGKYGAVAPSSLKVLLRPSKRNVENAKEMSALLEGDVPHLGEYENSFCCGK